MSTGWVFSFCFKESEPIFAQNPLKGIDDVKNTEGHKQGEGLVLKGQYGNCVSLLSLLCLVDVYKHDGRSKLLDLKPSTVTETVKDCYYRVIQSFKCTKYMQVHRRILPLGLGQELEATAAVGKQEGKTERNMK